MALGFVVVPDLSPIELVRLAAASIQNVADEFEDWDFLPDEDRGTRFEARTRAFEREVRTEEVCRNFREDGYDGNAAAFIVWILSERPRGWCASIPTAPDRLWRKRSDRLLHAPCFMGGGLFLGNVNDPWSSFWTFVAFRPIP